MSWMVNVSVDGIQIFTPALKHTSTLRFSNLMVSAEKCCCINLFIFVQYLLLVNHCIYMAYVIVNSGAAVGFR